MANKDEMQKVHHAVLRHYMDSGRAPHYTELAERFGVSPAKARQLLRETVEGSPYSVAWLTPDTDYVSSWAPFSSLANQHTITIQNQQKWGRSFSRAVPQWALEALAVCWLFPSKEISIDSRCLDSGDPILVRIRDGELLEVSPSTAVGYVNVPLPKWEEHSWAFNWARMNFFRSEENVRNWEDFNPESERQIKPVDQYAKVFSATLFRSRLDDDFVEKSGEYFQELSGLLAAGLGWA